MPSTSEEFTLPNNVPIVMLDCKTAFDSLTEKEKLYAHYMSRACWFGSLIILQQASPESPIIFTLLHKMFSEESIDDLRKKLSGKLTEDEFKAILVYTSGIFGNAGNYKGFGDTKIVPNIDIEKFELAIKESMAYKKNPVGMTALWERCKNKMYSLKDDEKSIGFPGKGITKYFSSNYSSRDIEILTDVMKRHNISPVNTRAVKIDANENDKAHYQILVASIETGIVTVEDNENGVFEIIKGDHCPLLERVNQNLLYAKKFASNELEIQMLDKFVESFKTGSIEEHKNASRFWIRDKNPIVETYIGFISRYRDPHGNRGEFKGYVALVNKEMSKKFTALVDRAEEFIPRLPWPKEFEKDKFQYPDFTSLDVLTFASVEIPAGLSHPIYDDVVRNDGFKNLSLGNVIPLSMKNRPRPFLSSDDADLLEKHVLLAWEMQVGLHELLGHCSGKLFRRSSEGIFDFDKENVLDPLTNSQVTSWYEPGEEYESVFTSIGSGYDECRAECVGLYLCLIPDIVRIFVEDDDLVETVTYVNWLLLVNTAFGNALEMYQPATETWLQAHSQARFAIGQVLLEAGDGLLEVTEPVVDEKLLIKLDRKKLQTVGKEAIKNFLLKLQVYQSTANIAEAKKLFDKYTRVSNEGSHPWLRWRNIVLKHKQPRRIFIQPNTSVIGNDDDVEVKAYAPTVEGLIESFVDRFPEREFLYSVLLELAEKDDVHFKY